MKKILVPLATQKNEHNTLAPLHYFRATYIQKLLTYNLVPLFVTTLMPKEMIDELYNHSDGIYFIGGTDFHPSTYGEHPHPKTDANDPERDALELYVLKKTLADKKPFLGICRGCEALAIASRGNLYQHLSDIFPEENHVLSPFYNDYTNGRKYNYFRKISSRSSRDSRAH